MEAVRAENQRLQRELGNLEVERNELNQELMEVRSQLEAERVDREESESQLSELQQNSAPTAKLSEKLTPDAAMILSRLRAKRKKSKVELADVEVLLKLLDDES